MCALLYCLVLLVALLTPLVALMHTVQAYLTRHLSFVYLSRTRECAATRTGSVVAKTGLPSVKDHDL